MWIRRQYRRSERKGFCGSGVSCVQRTDANVLTWIDCFGDRKLVGAKSITTRCGVLTCVNCAGFVSGDG